MQITTDAKASAGPKAVSNPREASSARENARRPLDPAPFEALPEARSAVDREHLDAFGTGSAGLRPAFERARGIEPPLGPLRGSTRARARDAGSAASFG